MLVGFTPEFVKDKFAPFPLLVALTMDFLRLRGLLMNSSIALSTESSLYKKETIQDGLEIYLLGGIIECRISMQLGVGMS